MFSKKIFSRVRAASFVALAAFIAPMSVLTTASSEVVDIPVAYVLKGQNMEALVDAASENGIEVTRKLPFMSAIGVEFTQSQLEAIAKSHAVKSISLGQNVSSELRVSGNYWNFSKQDDLLAGNYWNFTKQDDLLAGNYWNFSKQDDLLAGNYWNFSKQDDLLAGNYWNFNSALVG